MSSVTIYRQQASSADAGPGGRLHASRQTTMRFDDNRQNLAGRVAESLAKVL